MYKKKRGNKSLLSSPFKQRQISGKKKFLYEEQEIQSDKKAFSQIVSNGKGCKN